ncbi:MAG: pentapeptide repeat-containing protein [Nocardioides sp.]|uniref:pentapeptide repeat-containing protein n=1 Tax=Nocardioides sp. TaxID=35761 RepID=UPI0039E64354
MKAPEVTALRRRWDAADVELLRQQLLEQSRVVRPPHALGSRWPDTADGLTDLRGLDAGKQGIDLRYVTLERIDLSLSRGALTAFESELFDCRLDSVVLTGQPRLNRRFEPCSFRNAKLPRLALGPRIVDCDFTEAKAHRLRSVPNTVFERCTFDAADLAGAQFADTSFVDCTFADTQLSAATTFARCSFTRTGIDFAAARVSGSRADGDALPDRWEGEAEATAALDRYARTYARAVENGDEDAMPLDPAG